MVHCGGACVCVCACVSVSVCRGSGGRQLASLLWFTVVVRVCVCACMTELYSLPFHVSSSPCRGAPGRLMKLEDLQMLLDDFSIPLQIGTSSPSDSVRELQPLVCHSARTLES